MTYEDCLRLYGSTRSQRLGHARSLGRHTQIEWEAMKAIHNDSCAKCGDGEPRGGITKDHIIPIYKGGSDAIANIQPLCQRCNSGKSGCKDYRVAWKRKLKRIVKVFYQEQKAYGE